MSIREYSERELELIKNLDMDSIEKVNKLSLKNITVEMYSSYIIFAIQDAFLQGVNLRDSELIKAVTELPEWDLENVSAALISKKEVLELIKGGKG